MIYLGGMSSITLLMNLATVYETSKVNKNAFK
jgi:hypothetical protein